MKTIVTHFSPDFDAITSCWLIKKYLPGWKKADLVFVAAGLKLEQSDNNSDIIHVDTGMGLFDHHQTSKKTSASRLVLDYLEKKKLIGQKDLIAQQRLVDIVTYVDNFNEVFLPDSDSDIYDLSLYQLINGIKSKNNDDKKTCQIVFELLEAALINLKHKIRAEDEIRRGLIIITKWGKTLAMENKVEESIKLAQKKGFSLVIRKDPQNGVVRIKARPDTKENLNDLFLALKKADPKASWFLHSSKRILLNGSLKNPDTKPSSLSLKKIVEITKKI